MMLRMRKNLEMQLEQQPQDHSANATDSNASMTDGRGTNTQPIITAEIWNRNLKVQIDTFAKSETNSDVLHSLVNPMHQIHKLGKCAAHYSATNAKLDFCLCKDAVHVCQQWRRQALLFSARRRQRKSNTLRLVLWQTKTTLTNLVANPKTLSKTWNQAWLFLRSKLGPLGPRQIQKGGSGTKNRASRSDRKEWGKSIFT